MNQPPIILEICTDTLAASLAAQDGGAHRIELCSALDLGGLTPSAGLLEVVRQKIRLPIFVLIRPRPGDFCYSAMDFDVMKRDILLAKEMGANGVVSGVLLQNGHIDEARTRELIALARPLSFTFHRAFDLCADPLTGLDTLIRLGADRLLTSGQKSSAAEGAGLIATLVQRARQRLLVMPGAGIREENLNQLISITGAQEFHLSLRSRLESPMQFRRPGLGMGSRQMPGEYELHQADETRIRNLIQQIQA